LGRFRGVRKIQNPRLNGGRPLTTLKLPKLKEGPFGPQGELGRPLLNP